MTTPEVVLEFAAGAAAELVWRNELGGVTFRVRDRFVKWNPRPTEWLAGRHPAPRVRAWGQDTQAQWLVSAAVPGEQAVGPTWRARPGEAIRAIATGLRQLHAVPIGDFPPEWTPQVWVGRSPPSLGPRPPLEDPVLVHGDACGDLAVGDRWADLAIASMSLDWNFGEGHQAALFRAYDIEPDARRIDYYRRLWHLES